MLCSGKTTKFKLRPRSWIKYSINQLKDSTLVRKNAHGNITTPRSRNGSAKTLRPAMFWFLSDFGALGRWKSMSVRAWRLEGSACEKAAWSFGVSFNLSGGGRNFGAASNGGGDPRGRGKMHTHVRNTLGIQAVFELQSRLRFTARVHLN